MMVATMFRPWSCAATSPYARHQVVVAVGIRADNHIAIIITVQIGYVA
jgi:hypothetical protein